MYLEADGKDDKHEDPHEDVLEQSNDDEVQGTLRRISMCKGRERGGKEEETYERVADSKGIKETTPAEETCDDEGVDGSEEDGVGVNVIAHI